MICVYFAVQKYDSVWCNFPKDIIGQKYANLQTCKKDCSDLKALLDRYRLSDEDEVHMMDADPSTKQMKALFKALNTTIREGKKATPKKNYLIFYLFAGHGILKDGK